MSVMNGNTRKLPIYRPVAVHADSGSLTESGTSSDDDGSYSDSYSDPISEETEWEHEVNPKGELFYVRASAARGRPADVPIANVTSPTDAESVNNGHVRPVTEGGRHSPGGSVNSPESSPALSAASSSSSSVSSSLQKQKKFHHRLKWSNNKRTAPTSTVANATTDEVAPTEDQVNTDVVMGTVTLPTPETVNEVVLSTHVRQANLGRRSSALESLLGVIPGRHAIADPGRVGALSYSGAVMVQAVVPGSEASRHPGIRIGDWLYKINDKPITWLNMDNVLSNLMTPVRSDQVKLTLSKAIVSAKLPPPQRQESPCADNQHSGLLLPKLLSGDSDKWTKLMSTFASVPHVVLYVTLVSTENANMKDDILYQYPQGNSKIVPFRGALMTLCHMIPDVTGSPPISSLVMVGNELVHIGYATEGQEFFLVALPANRVTAYQVVQLVENIVCTLKYQYESLHNAFTDPTNLVGLDHLFSITLAGYLLSEETKKLEQQYVAISGLASHFALPQLLPLSNDLQSCIDGVLSELESSDFADLSEDHFDMRRLYSILGTCLFYKDYLVTNHLPDGEIANVFRYLHYSGILEMSRQSLTMEVVIWKEVFLETLPPVATAGSCRWFLLVVGKNHCLLTLLLEAGSCSAKASGLRSPDPFYVEQAQSSLLQLDLKQVPKSLESWLEFPTSPMIARVETFFSRNKKVSKDSTVAPRNGMDRTTDFAGKLGSSPSMLPFGTTTKKPASQPDISNLHVKMKDRHGETDSDSTSLSLTTSGTSDDTTPILGRRGQLQMPPSDARAPRWTWSDGDSPNEDEEGNGSPVKSKSHYRTRRHLPSQLDLMSLSENHPCSVRDRDRSAPPNKLTAGNQNVLFHYLQLNKADGILISVVQPESESQSDRHELQSQIVHNFKSSCLIIQQILRLNSELDSTGSDLSSDSTKQSPFTEHGMMFQCDVVTNTETNRGQDVLCYWVVGRLFLSPYPKEVYVCYHNSAPQSMVEIAFQLAFGLNV